MKLADTVTTTPATDARSETDSSDWRVRVASDADSLDALRENLLWLRGRGAPVSSNADPDHYRAVLDALPTGTQPYCATFVRPGGQPGAAIIGRIIKRRVRSSLGYWSIPTPKLRVLEIVYGGLLTDGRADSCQRLFDHLAQLIKQNDIQHIFINHLPIESPIAADLRQLGAIESSLEPHWVVRLTPGSYEQTLAKHSAKHRSKLRRYDRLLSKKFDQGLTLKRYSTRADLGEFLETADVITERSYHRSLGAPVRNTPLWRAITGVEADAGRMRCYILWGEDRPLCYQAGFGYDKVFLAHGRAFDEEFRDDRAGTILFFRIIEDLCRDGFEAFDLGFGDAEYKRLYADEFWNEASYRVYGRDLRSRASNLIDRSCILGTRAIKRLDDRRLARLRTWWKKRLGRKIDERRRS